MNLKERVLFVNCRWIETNQTNTLGDLVNHCQAELELHKRHLKEAEQLSRELGADAKLSDQRGYGWTDLWESCGRDHARWIAMNPNATVHELLSYLVSAHDQCLQLSDFTIQEVQEELEDELEYWLGPLPDDHDTDETMEEYCDSIREDIDDVYCLGLVVAKDFKVSDLPKPEWMLREMRKAARAA